MTEFGSSEREKPPSVSVKIMKKPATAKKTKRNANGLRAEYRFDYSKAKPNRFADRFQEGSRVVVLDPDIAQVFTTPESVNAVLRALLETMPRPTKRGPRE